MALIVAGTGHRPEQCEKEYVVRSKARTKLRYSKAETFICGMAAGFDLWAADEALDLGIKVIAARPWAGHSARVEDKELYEKVLRHAAQVEYIDNSKDYPGPGVYHARNQWMVDNATHVMAYLNPEATSGGTFQCVKYAKKKGKPVANIWADPPF